MNLETVSRNITTYQPVDKRKIPDIIDFGVTKGIPKINFEVKTLIINVSNTVTTEIKSCTLHNKKINSHFFQYKTSNNPFGLVWE